MNELSKKLITNLSIPITIILAVLLTSQTVLAELLIDPNTNGVLISQWDGDDAYDPFADYSDFDDSEEEEADVNFFRNGRLFTISVSSSYRSFTDTLNQIYNSSMGFGLYLTYFFDLRFAVQLGFGTGDHNMGIIGTTASNSATGTVSLTDIDFAIKYFFNTQNVTRGLAKLNPYIIGGITQFHRTILLDSEVTFAKDSAVGVDLGLGIEIPLLRGKLFLGLQAMYHLVNFADEKREIILDGDTVNGATGIFPSGDIYSGKVILGVNF